MDNNPDIEKDLEEMCEESNIEVGTNVENAFEEESPMEESMTDEIKVLSLQLKKSTIVEPPVLTEINTLSKRLKRYSTLGSPSIRKQGIHLKQRLKSQRKSGITKKLKKMNKALRIQVKSATSKAGEMSLTNQRITETEEMLSTLAEGSSEYNQKKLHHDHLKEIQKNTMCVFHELLSNFKTMSEECTKLHKERFTENLKLLTEPKKLCDV